MKFSYGCMWHVWSLLPAITIDGFGVDFQFGPFWVEAYWR